MSDIRTKPVTPEYEEAWGRIFGERLFDSAQTNSERIAIKVFTAGESLQKGELLVSKDDKVYKVTIKDIAKL